MMQKWIVDAALGAHLRSTHRSIQYLHSSPIDLTARSVHSREVLLENPCDKFETVGGKWRRGTLTFQVLNDSKEQIGSESLRSF